MRGGLPNMFCLVASSLGHLRSQCSIVCGSSLQRGHRGSAEEQWCVAGSQARQEDRVRSVAGSRAILGPGEPPYTSAVLGFVGGGSVNVLRMKDLAEA